MFKSKSFKGFIALLLLICFSVVAIPADLLHNHHEDEIACSDYGHEGSCSHKVHISKKKSFCFACTIHFDKAFTASENENSEINSPWISFLEENNIAQIIVNPLLTLLRGPPAQ